MPVQLTDIALRLPTIGGRMNTWPLSERCGSKPVLEKAGAEPYNCMKSDLLRSGLYATSLAGFGEQVIHNFTHS